jgi:hypothetical protein
MKEVMLEQMPLDMNTHSIETILNDFILSSAALDPFISPLYQDPYQYCLPLAHIMLPSPPQTILQPDPEESLRHARRVAAQKKKIREEARNLTCFNCQTQKTPLWRRTHDKKHNLCNACGLYYKQYNSHRPTNYKNKAPRISVGAFAK